MQYLYASAAYPGSNGIPEQVDPQVSEVHWPASELSRPVPALRLSLLKETTAAASPASQLPFAVPSWREATDTVSPAELFQLSARNVNQPAWVYASYYLGNDSAGDRFNEQIIAVKMGGSGSVERLARIHADWENVTGTAGQYRSKDLDYDHRSQPHRVPSPGAEQVIFSSNWVYLGNGGQGIEDYVINTGL